MAIDYGDMFSRYAGARVDRAMQPFTDPEAYLDNRLQQNFGVDMMANTTPVSTTIKYNDDGTQTVTQKNDVTPPASADYSIGANYGYTPQQQQPAMGGIGLQMPPAVAQPAPAAAPVAAVNPAAQDIEEQRRRQLEQAQLAAVQAQPAPMASPAPVAVAPQPMPDQTAAETQRLAAQNAMAAPVAPDQLAQAQATARSMAAQPAPQPGPPTQVAGEMVPGAVQQPFTGQGLQAPPGWMTTLPEIQNDPTRLAAFVGDGANPAEARRLASDRWQTLLTKSKEEQKANNLIERFPTDPKAANDLTRYIKSRSEEGSYVKAVLFARLGLTQLAQEEQAKLGKGGIESVFIGNEHFTVERNKAGGVTQAFDVNGNKVDDAVLARINAEALVGKGVETGKTLYKTPAGDVWSFATVAGRPGGLWTNNSTGQTQQTAPRGVTPFGQQDPAVVRGLQLKAAAEKQARIDNQKGAGYSEDQIRQLGNDAFKSFTGYNFNPRVAEAASEAASTGYVAPPGPRPEVGAVEQAQGGQGASGLSPELQNKIISAQRNYDEQKRLYDQSIANGTPGVLPNGNPVAAPGTSAHQGGGALDIDAKKLTRQDRIELAQKGYYQPMANDPNHWEPLPGTTPGKTAATTAELPVQARIESQAKAIANYESKPLTSGGSQGVYNQAVMQRVRELDPTYDETKYASVNKARQAFTTGKQGDTVRSMNTAVDHLDTLQGAANALNNNQLPLFNKIANEYQRNVGGPAITDFNSIKSIVGAEVAKAVAGGATALGDREEIRREIDAANSPAQLAGVIKRYQELLGGQLKGLRTQYEEAGLKDFDRKLTDRTKRILSGEQGGKTTRSNW